MAVRFVPLPVFLLIVMLRAVLVEGSLCGAAPRLLLPGSWVLKNLLLRHWVGGCCCFCGVAAGCLGAFRVAFTCVCRHRNFWSPQRALRGFDDNLVSDSNIKKCTIDVCISHGHYTVLFVLCMCGAVLFDVKILFLPLDRRACFVDAIWAWLSLWCRKYFDASAPCV